MIIDCFPFFDELDLLEIRLHELKDVVDVFVLTESNLTFSGKEKPLYFEENKRLFSEFNILSTNYTDDEHLAPMERERRQKQYNIDAAMRLMSKGDHIIVGDIDEIPRSSAVKAGIQSDKPAVGFAMLVFYYYMNCRWSNRNPLQRDSRLLKPEYHIKYNVKQRDKVDKIIQNAGWHFSFLGDIQKKISAWGHSDVYDKPPYNTIEHINKCRDSGTDIFMRKGKRRMEFSFENKLDYLPRYVKDNMEKFAKYIKNE